MNLRRHRYLAPIHHAIFHTSVRSNKRPGRFSAPSWRPTFLHPNTQRLIETIRHLTGNNDGAIVPILSALPTLQRIQAEFLGGLLTAVPVTHGPSRFLAMLDSSVRYKPPKQRDQVQLDVMALRQVDQGLRAFGVQLSESQLNRAA